MNQSLLNLALYSVQKYEICRQQSQCYLLRPPPQPPVLPKLILINSSSTFKNLHYRTDPVLIIFGIFLTLISAGLLLFFLSIKFQFYHKLRQRYCRTKDTNIPDEPLSYLSIVPRSYNSLTSLTTTTNESPSLTMINKSNRSLPQYLNADNRTFYHNHSINLYEEIRLPSDYHYYSHTLACYQHNHHLRPYYELSTSKIVCQNCLFKTLHRKQRCLCQNFFIPIK